MTEAKTSGTFVCPMCKTTKPVGLGTPVATLHDDMAVHVAGIVEGLDAQAMICDDCLDKVHGDYYGKLLGERAGELSELQKEVVSSLEAAELISDNINLQFEGKQTFGQRIADRVAAVGGSWAFIGGFGLVLLVWITLNSMLALRHAAFDPYPFILLNLVLSCLAAIQAPIIMMSQNRQAARDRLHAEQDYQVNLKAELQIHHMHEVLDHFVTQQWERLLEIQQAQTELMEELAIVTRPGKQREQ